jgi:hypothetical protein
LWWVEWRRKNKFDKERRRWNEHSLIGIKNNVCIRVNLQRSRLFVRTIVLIRTFRFGTPTCLVPWVPKKPIILRRRQTGKSAHNALVKRTPFLIPTTTGSSPCLNHCQTPSITPSPSQTAGPRQLPTPTPSMPPSGLPTATSSQSPTLKPAPNGDPSEVTSGGSTGYYNIGTFIGISVAWLWPLHAPPWCNKSSTHISFSSRHRLRLGHSHCAQASGWFRSIKNLHRRSFHPWYICRYFCTSILLPFTSFLPWHSSP